MHTTHRLQHRRRHRYTHNDDDIDINNVDVDMSTDVDVGDDAVVVGIDDVTDRQGPRL